MRYLLTLAQSVTLSPVLRTRCDKSPSCSYDVNAVTTRTKDNCIQYDCGATWVCRICLGLSRATNNLHSNQSWDRQHKMDYKYTASKLISLTTNCDYNYYYSYLITISQLNYY